MRLIDADELSERLVKCVQNRKAIVETKKDNKEHEYHLGKMSGYYAALKIVDAAPTIDPVKHGKWIADKYTKKCSECESTYWMREGNAWNYCPNCGARNGGEG